MITGLTAHLASMGPGSLLLIMAIVFAESGLLLGFLLPGDSLLFTSGLLVASGALGFPLWVVAVGVFLAALGGDQVGYLTGRHLGPRLFNRRGSRFFNPAHADRARLFVERHGPKAVLLARFVPVVRTLAPVVAGVGRMRYRTFAAFNVIGALTWGVGVLAAGYLLGDVAFVATHIDLIFVSMVAFSLVPAGLAYIRGHRRPSLPQPSQNLDLGPVPAHALGRHPVTTSVTR